MIELLNMLSSDWLATIFGIGLGLFVLMVMLADFCHSRGMYHYHLPLYIGYTSLVVAVICFFLKFLRTVWL